MLLFLLNVVPFEVVDEVASSSGEVPPLYLLVPLVTLSLSALG